MIGSRLQYFFGKAGSAVRYAPGLCVLAASTIAMALLMVGLYVMSLQNLESLALVWGRAAHVSCYLRDGLMDEHWQSVRSELANLPGVERADLVSPHVALQRFRARSVAAAALVEGVADDILPPSVEIYVQGGFSDLQAVAQVAAQAGKIKGVEEVDFGAEEFARLSSLIGLLRYGGLAVGLFGAVATALIVANTLRLAVYAQRDEIAILRLVGATGGFIQLPFLLEGAFWGASGGVLGAAMLYGLDHFAGPHISRAVAQVTDGLLVRLFAWRLAFLMIAVGVGLGIVGSGLAVRRYLDVESS